MTRRRTWAWSAIIGGGLALYPIHNQYLTSLTTNSRGETWFFLPAFAAVLWIMGSLWFVAVDRGGWKRVKAAGWGEKKVVIPLLVIVGAMGLSGVTATGVGAKLAPLFMGVSLFALYLACRVLGKSVLLPLTIGAVVASLGIIARQAWSYTGTTGGFIFENNFDASTGYILLGVSFFTGRQWLRYSLLALGVSGLLLSGAPEAVFALGVLGIAVLVRRDWNRTAVQVGAPVAAAVLAAVLLWGPLSRDSYLSRTLAGERMAHYVNLDGQEIMSSPIGMRVSVVRDASNRMSWTGDGYNVTAFTTRTVHNVPLVIVQQLGWIGIAAALAWLWVSLWGVRYTAWRYAWMAVLALSVWDHFTWTQMGPWWWALAGVSSAGGVENDLLFRRAA